MPDTHLTIHMLGVPIPVTVSWYLESKAEPGEIEIDQVTSDVLGDITDRVLNDMVGTGFYLTHTRLLPSQYQDPLQKLLFGQPTIYCTTDPRVRPESQPSPYMRPVWCHPGNEYWPTRQQHEAMRTEVRANGTLAEEVEDAIRATDEFAQAMNEVDEPEAWDW